MGISVKKDTRNKTYLTYKRNKIVLSLGIILGIIYISLVIFKDQKEVFDIIQLVVFILLICYMTYRMFNGWVLILDNSNQCLIYEDEKTPIKNIKYIFYEMSNKKDFSRRKDMYKIYLKTKNSKNINIFPEMMFLTTVKNTLKKLEKEGFKVKLEEEIK